MKRMIHSIGSLSEYITSQSEKSDRKKDSRKLSEQLKEERELLFGESKKRVFKTVLPNSKKHRRHMIELTEIKELENVFTEILDKINEVKKTNWTLEQVRNVKTYKLNSHRMTIGYVAYQCFFIKRKQIGAYFNMHHDIVGRANKMFIKLFEKISGEETEFLEVFDYFMILKKRNYQ